MHDLTHLDALWEMASLVAEGQVSVNPAEAFVLGGGILLHDAAMSLAAFPNGLADVKRTLEWKDAIARLKPVDEPSDGSPVWANDPPEGVVHSVLPDVLRRLHAQQAAVLAEQGWKTANGDTVYLIEDFELRFFYGPTIGQCS